MMDVIDINAGATAWRTLKKIREKEKRKPQRQESRGYCTGEQQGWGYLYRKFHGKDDIRPHTPHRDYRRWRCRKRKHVRKPGRNGGARSLAFPTRVIFLQTGWCCHRDANARALPEL